MRSKLHLHDAKMDYLRLTFSRDQSKKKCSLNVIHKLLPAKFYLSLSRGAVGYELFVIIEVLYHIWWKIYCIFSVKTDRNDDLLGLCTGTLQFVYNACNSPNCVQQFSQNVAANVASSER